MSLTALFAQATVMTLGLALSSLALGLLMAMAFSLAELSRYKPLALAASTVVAVMRGLPEILVVFFIYFGSTHALFLVTDEFVEISPFVAGTIALSLIYSAYASQTLRGAFMAIPKGQTEAAVALGISRSHCFFRIILPQTWRHALPGLGNQWLVLLKDTALVALIGVHDLLLQARMTAASTYEPFTWYGVAALIYLAITLISQSVLERMKSRANRHLTSSHNTAEISVEKAVSPSEATP
ncbi:arginine ABC transporter permease ArtQ [Endozoicomonas sp. SCSIO W0465]|uniref:arginine ABC transporter permease ArtQ n=1 Tax=Endozoicomonas sp. SCSIO W0465 TaxID=2918516 RepID=UPI00207518E7|nr:arginine ABC transporter permease ArtQ [Endozoicomonas sp. SCSIO W0465]USE34756.1 arginine ABC transporter permease ArtQ [Endozoicomonas sp. SCSIO W0465]